MRSNERIGDGLFNGELGVVIYKFYKYKLENTTKDYEDGVRMLNGVLKRLNTKTTLTNLSLSNGIAGLGFALHLLKEDYLIDLDTESLLQDLIDLLFELSIDAVAESNLEFSLGVSGVIHFFNQLLYKPDVRHRTANLIKMIIEKTFKNREFSYPAENVFLYKYSVNQTYINLTFAHGLSGLLNILMNFYVLYPENNLYDYLNAGLLFIMQFKKYPVLSKEEVCLFPSFVEDPNSTPNKIYKEWYKSRLAWCIGDLNMAYLFLKAGRILSNPHFSNIGNETAQFTATRKSLTETKVSDPFICHGSSGIAAMYKILFQESGTQAYRESYEYWLDQTRHYINGSSLSIEKESLSLLNGRTGVELVLKEQRLPLMENSNWVKIFLA